MGKDVTSMVREFFIIGQLGHGLNETNVVLILKKKNLAMITELRPISLCSALVKIITKVVANRMKVLQHSIVSEIQSIIIPERLIMDNVMVTYEIMHQLKRKMRGRESYMALKFDMSKAYDRIEWEYLRATFNKMGFHDW